MFTLALFSIFAIPGLLFLGVVAACGPNRLNHPNGYSSRGGRFKPNKIVYGKPINYKHGQAVYVGSLNDFLANNNKAKLKYYNKNTDDFEDIDPTV